MEFILADPVRTSSLRSAIPEEVEGVQTLDDLLVFYRQADLAVLASRGLLPRNQLLELQRFADSLFVLNDDGSLGELDPDLQFYVDGEHVDLQDPVLERCPTKPILIEVDRSLAGYRRNWPGFLRRRWSLRADDYSHFVSTILEEAYGDEAEDVLRLDTPYRVEQFLGAVGARIHAAPYETYSRYLEPYSPFKSCDQTLDRLMEGNGGVCAEKAMALYFIASAYKIPAEIVLGGEDASGSFPYRTLRTILDQPRFEFQGTGTVQRYWQHYAILCKTTESDEDQLFCDVAGSNIPFLCQRLGEVQSLLDPRRRKPLNVTITLEPLRLYYHRIARRQDLPLDLYYAMEYLIESIDLVQTIDNELGLLHNGQFWIGAVASRGPRELRQIAQDYKAFVACSGLDPDTNLCFTRDLSKAEHRLADDFLANHPQHGALIQAGDARLRARLSASSPGSELSYVIIHIRKPKQGH